MMGVVVVDDDDDDDVEAPENPHIDYKTYIVGLGIIVCPTCCFLLGGKVALIIREKMIRGMSTL